VDLEKEALFAHVIESIYERHSGTLITMAKGTADREDKIRQDRIPTLFCSGFFLLICRQGSEL
jgi:hypothetical protein